MLFITIISLIVAKALPVLNTQITSPQFTRITTISLIFSGLISLNTLNLETIGSGIGIYSGLFHITVISQIFEIFIYLIGGFILMGWYLPSPAKAALARHQSHLRGTGKLAKPRLSLGQGLGQITEHLSNFKSGLAPSNKKQSDYSLIVLFSLLGSSLLISSFDLISIYLSIELQSFGLYVLSTLYKDSESSTSSGLKYFLLGGLSSCIILLGIGLIYSYTGITNLESLSLLNTVTYPLASAQKAVNTGYVLEGLSLGLILIFVGFLFKIAASPLHNWSPDVYDGVPTIVTSWLTIIPKISILILLLELQIQIGSADAIIGGIKNLIIGNTGYLLDLSSAHSFVVVEPALTVAGFNAVKSLLLISSILSLIIGSLLGLAQIRIKRLLAYSTISHIGFLLLALAINTEVSIDSFLFYLLQYTMTNLNIFLIILAFTPSLANARGGHLISKPNNNLTNTSPLAYAYAYGEGGFDKDKLLTRDIRYLSEFKGLFFSNPFLSLSLAVSLFSMAGIPPLIGFFSKQFVLYSALQNGYYFISILAIIVSVISASYYLKIVKLLVESPSPRNSSYFYSKNTPNKNEGNPAFAGDETLPLARGQGISSTNAKGNGSASLIEQGFCEKVEISNVHSYLISIFTITILLFFIKPSIILNSSKLLTLSLFCI